MKKNNKICLFSYFGNTLNSKSDKKMKQMGLFTPRLVLLLFIL